MLKRVWHDVFDVTSRLKDVNRYYVVFFNTNSKNFELFFKKGNRQEFCLNLGKTLDAKSVKLAITTQTKNSRKIFKDIFDTNQKIEEENNRILKEFSSDNLHAYLEYADKKGGDINFLGANSFRWI